MPDSVPAGGSIELRHVSKHYGISKDQQVSAADDVSLTIEPGAFVSLTGASGSGKSTLLHLIGAIERPDSGTIVSAGVEVTALRGAPLAAYRRTVGFVFQRYNLLPALPARMSGGEQQRVALARALINTPALLLADEPTGNLDSQNAAEILNLLASLREEHTMTIVLASHDPQIAARSERLIRLRDGAVVDDIELSGGYSVEDMIRRVGQLG